MNNEYDSFMEAIKDIKIEKPEFKLSQIKIEHFYFNYDNTEDKAPVQISIELKKGINSKIITNTFIDPNNHNKTIEENYSIDISNVEEVLKEIEKIDLRDLKNNYYNEKESYTHWSIIYNNEFKIVGTYDQEIEEFKKISEILNLKEEINKTISE